MFGGEQWMYPQVLTIPEFDFCSGHGFDYIVRIPVQYGCILFENEHVIVKLHCLLQK